LKWLRFTTVWGLSSGLGSVPGLHFESLKQGSIESIWKGLERQIDVRRAMLGANAGLTGAALAATIGLR
jgi:hypothetical protein